MRVPKGPGSIDHSHREGGRGTRRKGGGFGLIGRDKTVELMTSGFDWPGMRRDVEKFLQGCRTCQLAKGQMQNKGLYMPLPVSNRPWVEVSMDFVVLFPKS